MAYRQFIVPTDHDFVASLGVTPEARGEDGVRGISIRAPNGFAIDLTVDPSRSIDDPERQTRRVRNHANYQRRGNSASTGAHVTRDCDRVHNGRHGRAN